MGSFIRKNSPFSDGTEINHRSPFFFKIWGKSFYFPKRLKEAFKSGEKPSYIICNCLHYFIFLASVSLLSQILPCQNVYFTSRLILLENYFSDLHFEKIFQH